MTQKLFSGFAATLLISTLGIVPTYASALGVGDDSSELKVAVEEDASPQMASTPPLAPPPVDLSAIPPEEVVKVGEYQSDADPEVAAAIANIQPHVLSNRQAASLYVRGIPVLTFLGAELELESPASPGTSQDVAGDRLDAEEPVKVASVQTTNETTVAPASPPDNRYASTGGLPFVSSAPQVKAAVMEQDPIWRATAIAAQLNQLHREGLDANIITAAWDEQRQQYVLKVGEVVLIELNDDTLLPNSNHPAEEEALHAVNRLRQQFGNAPPLSSIAGRPRPPRSLQLPEQISLGPIRLTFTGMASWYGPGFHGNTSASGEVFRQEAMTAAHRTLPFGTQVRVTNLDNGQSVVVRINDRGPFVGNRVIDLSAGAARVIGMLGSGIAPVSLEVLDSNASYYP